MHFKTTLKFAVLLATLGLQTACSTLIGNVDPVDEKSEEYGIADLAKENPAEWTKLDPAQLASKEDDLSPSSSPDVSDVTYQSKSTAATISLNSACRPAHGNPALEAPQGSDQELRKLTDQLFLGITDVTLREEKSAAIQKGPSLETTILGKMETAPVKLRVVVLKRGAGKNVCVYDLVYLAPPEHFAKNEADFSHFVASLRLK